MFVSILSRNENNNGFDSIGMNSFLFDYRRVVYFPFCCCILHCFPWLLALDWMRCSRIEHHLAAKFGTISAFLYERSSLLWMDDILGWWFSWCGGFLVEFALISANFIIQR